MGKIPEVICLEMFNPGQEGIVLFSNVAWISMGYDPAYRQAGFGADPVKNLNGSDLRS